LPYHPNYIKKNFKTIYICLDWSVPPRFFSCPCLWGCLFS